MNKTTTDISPALELAHLRAERDALKAENAEHIRQKQSLMAERDATLMRNKDCRAALAACSDVAIKHGATIAELRSKSSMANRIARQGDDLAKQAATIAEYSKELSASRQAIATLTAALRGIAAELDGYFVTKAESDLAIFNAGHAARAALAQCAK